MALQSFIGMPLRCVEDIIFSMELQTQNRGPGAVNQSGLSTLQQHALEELLTKYNRVFQESKGLPPIRQEKHLIGLQEGHRPMNVRPYCYPYHHKNEIEKQVCEMLNSGMIRPS